MEMSFMSDVCVGMFSSWLTQKVMLFLISLVLIGHTEQ